MVGNVSNYSKYDIIRVLLKVDEDISRVTISKELGLGEGTVRSILNILKEKGIISSTKKGHSLTDKGNEIKNKICNNIAFIKKVDISDFSGKRQVLIGIKKSNIPKIDYELRDVAVKNKADGALILINHKGKLRIPDFEYKKDFSEIERYVESDEEKILLLTFAEDYRIAECAGLAVCENMICILKKVFEKF